MKTNARIPEFPCPFCEKVVTVKTLLQRVAGYYRITNSAHAPCPSCGKDIEFQAHGGMLTIGYTYAAGSFHFEGLFDVAART